MNLPPDNITRIANEIRQERNTAARIVSRNPILAEQLAQQYNAYLPTIAVFKEQYPRLVKRAEANQDHTPSQFTREELLERTRLVDELQEVDFRPVMYLALQRRLQRRDEEVREDAMFKQVQADCKEFICVGLYLLAECGDNGAFLELAYKDFGFWQDVSFHEVVAGWKNKVFQGEANPYGSHLRELAKILSYPHHPFHTHKKDEMKDDFAISEYERLKEELGPNSSNNAIFRAMVKTWETEFGEKVQPDSIRRRRDRMINQWRFKYLKKNFENTLKNADTALLSICPRVV